MSYESIIVDKEDRIATITLNRPATLNALTPGMHDELAAATEELARDSSIRVVIITGAGKGFCSGGDRSVSIWDNASGEAIREFTLRASRSVVNIWEMEKPVIAAVNGAAAGGGCNLALACDIIIASEKAKFTQVYSRIGATPDMGGIYLLPRLVGMARANELLLTGRIIDANEAERLGLVCRVVPPDSLTSVARELALDLAQRSAAALGLTKKAVHAAMTLDFRAATELEAYVEVLARGSSESASAWDASGKK